MDIFRIKLAKLMLFALVGMIIAKVFLTDLFPGETIIGKPYINGVLIFGSPIRYEKGEKFDGRYSFTLCSGEERKEIWTVLPEKKYLSRFLYCSETQTIIGFIWPVATDENSEELWQCELKGEKQDWEKLGPKFKGRESKYISLYGPNTLSVPTGDSLYLMDIHSGEMVKEIYRGETAYSGTWNASSQICVFRVENGPVMINSKGEILKKRNIGGFFHNICVRNEKEIIFSRRNRLMSYNFDKNRTRKIAKFDGDIYELALSPDGKQVAVYHEVDGLVGSSHQTLEIVDIETKKREILFSQPHESSIISLVWGKQ